MATADEDDPDYVLLDLMTDEDVETNIQRLRSEAEDLLKHADMLKAWAASRRPQTPVK